MPSLGAARPGLVRHGMDLLEAGCGADRHGPVGRGPVRRGKAEMGVVGTGAARHGIFCPRLGRNRKGRTWSGTECRGEAWNGLPRRAQAIPGMAWKSKEFKMVAKAKPIDVTAIHPVTNGAEPQIDFQMPYRVNVTVQGVAPILFHAWNNEAVEAKAAAAKGSKAKKSDDLESYVYRTAAGTLGIRGVSLQRAIIEIGRYHQDPRSPRKSAMDLLKAAIVPLTELADTGAEKWDYVDRRRVLIQRSAITRARPALNTGWKATFELLVTTPEYVAADWLNGLIQQAGRLVGLGDFRPTYGRFQVIRFDVLSGLDA